MAVGIMRELVRRLRLIDEKIKRMSLLEAPGRVAGAIMEVIEERDLPRMNNLVLKGMPLHKDLAQQAGVSRETFSKVIGTFAERGILERQGGNLVVRDYVRFAKYVR